MACISYVTPCSISNVHKLSNMESFSFHYSAAVASPASQQLLGNSFLAPQIALSSQSSQSFQKLNRRSSKLSRAGDYRKTGSLHITQKMVVPGFGDLKSPEGKAADSLHNFFTFVALRVVLSQLRSYNQEAHAVLQGFVDVVPIRDGDLWLEQLMRESPEHQSLALRIMEVRSAYCREDFEWDNLQKLAMKKMDKENTRLIRERVMETIKLE